MIQLDHPTAKVFEPAPGHYVLRGHNPAETQTESGRIVPLDVCYVTPEVPTEFLRAIIEEREGAAAPKRERRKRISSEAIAAEEIAEGGLA